MKNINHVGQYLKGEYGFEEGEFSKFGPSNKSPNYSNIVFRTNGVNGKGLFIKGFDKSGEKHGIAELKMIDKLNEFHKSGSGLFKGPEIVQVFEKPFHFVMHELANPIDFTQLSQDKLMQIYMQYREEFNQFEEFADGLITGSKLEHKILKAIQTIKKLENKITIIKKGILGLIKIKQTQSLTQWISNSATIGLVEKTLPGFSQKGLQEFTQSFSGLSNILFEYDFGRFWTGHVFGNMDEGFGLVDFDNVGYQIKGTELLGIIRSTTLLNHHSFTDYQSFKKSFDYWYQKLHQTIGDEQLANHLIKMKILATIFADYGYLMNTEPGNISTIEQGGYDVVSYNSKGIQWNYQLLCDFFPEYMV